MEDIQRGKEPITVRLTPPLIAMIAASIISIVSIAVFIRTNQVDVMRLQDAINDSRLERRSLARSHDSLASAHSYTQWRLENIEALVERNLHARPSTRSQ